MFRLPSRQLFLHKSLSPTHTPTFSKRGGGGKAKMGGLVGGGFGCLVGEINSGTCRENGGGGNGGCKQGGKRGGGINGVYKTKIMKIEK